MNRNWTRWLSASLNKHFDDNKGPYPLFLEGTERNTDKEKIYAEFRMNGPFFTGVAKNQWKVAINASVLVSASITNELYALPKAVGWFQNVFTGIIDIYKIGKEPEDDGTVLGCLILTSEIFTNNFGQLSPDIRLRQSEINATYQIDLED